MAPKNSDIEVRNRLKDVLKNYRVSENALADGDAATQKRLNRQLAGAAITAETLALVLDRFPDLSAEWLIRGTGTMSGADPQQISTNKNAAINGGINGNINSHIQAEAETSALVSQLAVKDKQIADMQKTIDGLMQLLAAK